MRVIPYYQDNVLKANKQPYKFPFQIHHYSSTGVGPHHHDFAEINFIVNGHVRQQVNGWEGTLTEGSLSFIMPHYIHQSSAVDSGLVKYCLIFDIDLIGNVPMDSKMYSYLLRMGSDLSPFTSMQCSSQMKKVTQLLEDMMKEFAAKKEGHRNMILIKLTELLIHLVRVHRDYHALPVEAARNSIHESLVGGEMVAIPPHQGSLDVGELLSRRDGKGKEHIWEILREVHVRYNDSLTLEALSSDFNMSSSYMSRLFKQAVGQPFLQYIHSLRLRNAASLLSSTERPVCEIVEEVGFDSVRTFNRLFKKAYGKTPIEFRCDKA